MEEDPDREQKYLVRKKGVSKVSEREQLVK